MPKNSKKKLAPRPSLSRIHGTDIDSIIDTLEANRGNISDLSVIYLDKEDRWYYDYSKISCFSKTIFMLEYLKAQLMRSWMNRPEKG